MFFAACLLAASAFAKQPDLIFVLVDDWGYANAGYKRDPSWPGNNETQTPNIDKLARGGLILDRHYVFKLCSPTRSALQTGRNPIHVNVLNSPIMQHNPADPEAGFQGAARSFTGIAEKLRGVGYSTHQVGKWNAGMALHKQTPAGRGYNSSLYYYDYDTFFWNNTIENCRVDKTVFPMTDLSTSLNGGPATPAWGMNNTWECSQSNETPEACPHGYQDDLFMRRVEEVISNASAAPDTPLFLFWAPHAPHDPYEVPAAYLEKFSSIDVVRRQYYTAMVNYLDGNFGRLEAALRAAGRWDNTLVVVSSDNGGPVDPVRGGNNFPLRGSKGTNFEGGIRVNAFAFGGALDPALSGTTTEELTAIEDCSFFFFFCSQKLRPLHCASTPQRAHTSDSTHYPPLATFHSTQGTLLFQGLRAQTPLTPPLQQRAFRPWMAWT
jgi:arylsulfatase B